MRKLDFRILGPCLLAIAIDAMGFGLVYPMMSAIFGDAHAGVLPMDITPRMRNFYLGLGYAAYPFGMFFGSSLMGELSDAFGRRKILLLCVVGLAISYAMMGMGVLCSSLALLLIGRGLSGLMAGCQGIAQAAITDVSTPETKAFNMSIMSVAFSAGIVIGPVLGGVASDSSLSPAFGYGTPFLIVGAVSLLCALWVWRSYVATAPSAGTANLDPLLPVRQILQAARDKAIAYLSLVFLLMQVGYGLYLQTIMLLLQDSYHYQSLQLGLFSGMIGVCFVFGLLVVVRLMLRVSGVVGIAKTGFLVAGLCQILSALYPGETSLWLFGALVGCFDMVAYTAMYTAFSDAAAEDRQGWALGVAGSVMAIAWVITGFLTNLLPLMGERGLLALGGFCFLASLSLMLFYQRSPSAGRVTAIDINNANAIKHNAGLPNL